MTGLTREHLQMVKFEDTVWESKGNEGERIVLLPTSHQEQEVPSKWFPFSHWLLDFVKEGPRSQDKATGLEKSGTLKQLDRKGDFYP